MSYITNQGTTGVSTWEQSEKDVMHTLARIEGKLDGVDTRVSELAASVAEQKGRLAGVSAVVAGAVSGGIMVVKALWHGK
jgi:hypothetical protein